MSDGSEPTPHEVGKAGGAACLPTRAAPPGVAPMDAAAKAASAQQQVVGTPVPGPRLRASVPAGVADVVAQLAAAVAPGVTVDGHVSETGAVSFSASRGASPPRHAADAMPVCAAPTAARTTISASYHAPPERLDTARAKPRSVHVAGLRFS